MFEAGVWGTVADWVTALTAIIGVGFGLSQLRAIKRSEAATAVGAGKAAEVQRARFLVGLDDRFESAEMGESRRAHRALRNRFEAEAERDGKGLNDEARAALAASLFSRHLTAVLDAARTLDEGSVPNAAHPVEDEGARGYALIMRLPYWIETVGFLVSRELVDKEDILRLYDQAIITTITNISQHVADRGRQGPHPNPAFLEHAIWLCAEAKARKSALAGRSSLPAAPER